jgi:hypothetical protein
MSTTKISVSLPRELVTKIEETRAVSQLPFSASIADLLRQALHERSRVPVLERRVADLEKALAAANAELKLRPPIDSRDYLLNLPAGTSKRADDLQWSERQRRQLAAELESARREMVEWQESSAAWEEECTTLEAKLARCKAERVQLQREIGARAEMIASKDADIARLSAQHSLQMREEAHVAYGWGLITAVPAVAALALLLLFLVPSETGAMRFIATAAMGETGDRHRAAVRLHGMPLGGINSQLQLYVLAHVGDNRERLFDCFQKAVALKPNRRRKSIPCTIDVPHEQEVEAVLLRKGPLPLPQEVRRALRRSERVIVTVTPAMTEHD